jgi:hypothetical protein
MEFFGDGIYFAQNTDVIAGELSVLDGMME